MVQRFLHPVDSNSLVPRVTYFYGFVTFATGIREYKWTYLEPVKPIYSSQVLK